MSEIDAEMDRVFAESRLEALRSLCCEMTERYHPAVASRALRCIRSVESAAGAESLLAWIVAAGRRGQGRVFTQEQIEQEAAQWLEPYARRIPRATAGRRPRDDTGAGRRLWGDRSVRRGLRAAAGELGVEGFEVGGGPGSLGSG
jgi:hypothetical protein